MKIQYFPDTDTLYIRLSNTKVANTDMINESLIVDLDADEKVVGITIEQASETTDLTDFEATITLVSRLGKVKIDQISAKVTAASKVPHTLERLDIS